MHKNTKLLPYQRQEIFRRWGMGETITKLAQEYKISRETIYGTLKDARLGVFRNRSSMNPRYRQIHYGFKKLRTTEGKVALKLQRAAHRLNRYEKSTPGEMVHFDTKRLPLLKENHPHNHESICLWDLTIIAVLRLQISSQTKQHTLLPYSSRKPSPHFLFVSSVPIQTTVQSIAVSKDMRFERYAPTTRSLNHSPRWSIRGPMEKQSAWSAHYSKNGTERTSLLHGTIEGAPCMHL